MKKTALLSVYDKTGIVEFAKALVELGWNILSSGGTAKVISAAGISVTDVATLIGGKAILGHRVVTLSRQVHAGILARYIEEDLRELETEKIPLIDLVCVDMYPLKEEISKPDCTVESVIEKTDIGGPTMLRSAVKGRRIVLCEAGDRPRVIEWLKSGEPEKEKFINELVAKAESVVADYVLSSAIYHGKGKYTGMVGTQKTVCKYGENGHQIPAALYCKSDNEDHLAIDKFKITAGTEPSYNNYCDIDRLLQTMTHIAATFDINYNRIPFIALGAKHGNVCGAAIGFSSPEEVTKNMILGDPLAIFGGLVMLNFQVTKKITEAILSYRASKILDGIIAPGFDDGTMEMMKRKGDKCRFIVNPSLANLSHDSLDKNPRFRYVRGGLLLQPNYTFILDLKNPELKKIGQATEEQERDMLLAKAICDTSNSNTITLVIKGTLIGNGVGQQARVYGSMLALDRATACGHSILGASAASDSFFPYTDGVEALVKAGVKSIISTSGSVKDEDVIKYCQKKDIALYLIPDKIGRGFFGH